MRNLYLLPVVADSSPALAFNPFHEASLASSKVTKIPQGKEKKEQPRVIQKQEIFPLTTILTLKFHFLCPLALRLIMHPGPFLSSSYGLPHSRRRHALKRASDISTPFFLF